MENMLNGNVPFEFSSEPVGGEYRGIGADYFNNEDVAAEDWKRTQQTANNQFYRDLWLQNRQNSWQSAENDKAYERNLEMDSTKYQRTIADMKKAGINPIMLMGHSVDSPISPTASASSARSSGSNYRGAGSADSTGVVSSIANGLLRVIAGLVTKGNTYNYTIKAGKKK